MNTLWKNKVKPKKKRTSIQLLLLHWIVNQSTTTLVRNVFFSPRPKPWYPRAMLVNWWHKSPRNISFRSRSFDHPGLFFITSHSNYIQIRIFPHYNKINLSNCYTYDYTKKNALDFFDEMNNENGKKQHDPFILDVSRPEQNAGQQRKFTTPVQ